MSPVLETYSKCETTLKAKNSAFKTAHLLRLFHYMFILYYQLDIWRFVVKTEFHHVTRHVFQLMQNFCKTPDELTFSICLINKGQVKLRSVCSCVRVWRLGTSSRTHRSSLAELSSSACNKTTCFYSANQEGGRISPEGTTACYLWWHHTGL